MYFKRWSLITVGILLLLRASPASALTWPSLALGPLISSTGIGVEASTPIIPRFLNLNIGYTAFGFTDVVTVDCIRLGDERKFCMPFDGTARLGAIPLFLTLYPFGGWFNLQGGVYFNNNQLTVTATAPPPYTAFGSASGETHFRVVAPYVGIGFGQPFRGGRFTITGSAGVMFEGAPKIQLRASNAAVMNIPGVSQQAQNEQDIINHDARLTQYFPIVSLALVYRF
jgi:hypothetical protein